MVIDIIPYQQIGELHLNTSIEEMRGMFDGKFSTKKGEVATIDYFLDASIQVEYDQKGKVGFIGIRKPFGANLDGVDLMELNFQQIRSYLANKDNNIYQEISVITCVDLGLSIYASDLQDESYPEEVGIFRKGHFDSYLLESEKMEPK